MPTGDEGALGRYTPRGYNRPLPALSSLTRSAISATLQGLTGCAIGEILGMVLAEALGWHDAAQIALAVVLAFVFGYGLTIVSLIRRAGLSLRRALPLAGASDTASIATMELVDNGFVALVPGALAAGLADGLFWGSLGASLVVAFLLTVPVNRWLIARGRGHALVHAHHH